MNGKANLVFNILIISTGIITFSGCCEHVDCASVFVIKVDVVNAVGQNLFSQNPRFSVDDVSASFISDTTIRTISHRVLRMDGRSIIYLEDLNGNGEYVLHYSPSESDTLTVTNYTEDDTGCCIAMTNYDLQINHQVHCTHCSEEITIMR